MAETFGVNQQDLGKLLLLCKRAIYPRIYPLLAIPASVHEEDKKLGEQMTWLNKLDPAVLREGLKLDKRPFQVIIIFIYCLFVIVYYYFFSSV